VTKKIKKSWFLVCLAVFSSPIFSETYTCSYIHQNEITTTVLIRDKNSFREEGSGSSWNIAEESPYQILMTRTYSTVSIIKGGAVVAGPRFFRMSFQN
jgi:hypothetical protein